jgi:hypothetical protein
VRGVLRVPYQSFTQAPTETPRPATSEVDESGFNAGAGGGDVTAGAVPSAATTSGSSRMIALGKIRMWVLLTKPFAVLAPPCLLE